ncbi:hypothetical protein [Actinomadura harenae]|uniref:Uncharacterized protein n=1 Tax=Actinomadura harenae TaxID=2483351 RepID=A0A3M2MAQ1_9ACTN|nr:hypothetical protein [Actinomadura harenae]RMI46561.1 hypothetical protein EBO15_06420 [Actinomadura harenae]
MRIPKPVNAALDWAELHFGALAAVVALVVAAGAALALPRLVGLPLAGFVLGTAIGGFLVYARMSRRLARARKENDDLLRENGAMRHRNTVLSSGVITRQSQTTQALLMIPDDEDLDGGGSGGTNRTQSTVQLPELPDGL